MSKILKSEEWLDREHLMAVHTPSPWHPHVEVVSKYASFNPVVEYVGPVIDYGAVACLSGRPEEIRCYVDKGNEAAMNMIEHSINLEIDVQVLQDDITSFRGNDADFVVIYAHKPGMEQWVKEFIARNSTNKRKVAYLAILNPTEECLNCFDKLPKIEYFSDRNLGIVILKT